MDIEERIVSRILVNPITGCWEWQGCRLKKGYGFIKYKRKNWTVHRLLFMLRSAEFNPSLSVLHLCDNPPCCNPAHLMQGDFRENAIQARDRLGMSQGERNGSAKLTEEQVLNIRQDSRHPADIAKEYDVVRSCIINIKNRKRWAHLL